MGLNIAINGFGRIGRSLFRLFSRHPEVAIGAINDPIPTAQIAHLIRYDTVMGPFQGKVEAHGGSIMVDGTFIPVFHESSSGTVNWGDLGVDYVVASSGVCNSRAQLERYRKKGVKRVFVSRPLPGVADCHVLMGLNHEGLKGEERIISGGSCTAHCFAPLVLLLDDAFGVKGGFMTTVHSYTSAQNLIDGGHERDIRRGRAAAQNIVPTTTEAIAAFEEALPQYRNLLVGSAVRVPVVNGSFVELIVEVDEDVTRQAVNEVLAQGAEGRFRNVLQYTRDPLVSSDIIGNPHSAIVDGLLTEVVNGRLVKVLSWYDNEWGYSNRLAELLQYMWKRFQD